MPGADVILDALGLIVRELALFAATGILIGGLNDLAVDCLWFAGRGKQLLSSGRTQLPALDRLPAPKRTGPMAVMIPAWDEAAVIAPMLAHSLKIFAGENVHIFVGCYPNDPLTIDEIRFFADTHPRIELALCPGNGPTTKADCLNAIWRTLENAEHRRGKRFKAIILHDAEDIVHRGEIALFDRLIEGHALVQVPVRPLPDRRSRWIANHYCDEFAEAHGKDLVVRTMLAAGIPSAGVGCAIDRAILGALAAERDGRPFDAQSLTEDYELGLRIAARGGRGIFVRMRDTNGGDLIAVHSHFPPDLNAAVRQKTRWVTGIALAGWERLGWNGGWAERWMRLRDRATMLDALVLFAAYAALLLSVVLLTMAALTSYSPAPLSRLLKTLLALNFCLLIWRLAMRALFTARSYGWREGLWAIPRAITSNVIAMMAARRALVAYLRSNPALPPRWDKTRHIFPDFGAGG